MEKRKRSERTQGKLTDGGSRFVQLGQDTIVLLDLGHNALNIVGTDCLRHGGATATTPATTDSTGDTGDATDGRFRHRDGH